MFNTYEQFKKYAVPAESIEDFLKKYTKPKAHKERGREYVDYRIKSFKEEFEKNSFVFITHHDSITGEIVAFYGAK